ncbi:MAG TPA: hypothetical protein VFF16_06270 [Telluria sp.]|nr:hypothetical protein [Telluria sp.]
MNLERYLDQHRQLAALCQVMDDDLGLHHGLSWSDFVLLDTLEAAGGALPPAALAQKLNVSRSRLLLQLLPLEKIGLLTRAVALRPNGRRQLREARDTATRLCEDHFKSASRTSRS